MGDNLNDGAIIKLLEDRKGWLAVLVLDDGTQVTIKDVSYSRDLGDENALIYADSSTANDSALCVRTNEIAGILDADTGTQLISLSG